MQDLGESGNSGVQCVVEVGIYGEVKREERREEGRKAGREFPVCFVSGCGKRLFCEEGGTITMYYGSFLLL